MVAAGPVLKTLLDLLLVLNPVQVCKLEPIPVFLNLKQPLLHSLILFEQKTAPQLIRILIKTAHKVILNAADRLLDYLYDLSTLLVVLSARIHLHPPIPKIMDVIALLRVLTNELDYLFLHVVAQLDTFVLFVL